MTIWLSLVDLLVLPGEGRWGKAIPARNRKTTDSRLGLKRIPQSQSDSPAIRMARAFTRPPAALIFSSDMVQKWAR